MIPCDFGRFTFVKDREKRLTLKAAEGKSSGKRD
jgi:hypothetical protein